MTEHALADENIHVLTRSYYDLVGAVSATYARLDEGLVFLADPRPDRQDATSGLTQSRQYPVVVRGKVLASFLKDATPGPKELRALEMLARAMTVEVQRRDWNAAQLRIIAEQAPDVIYRMEVHPERRLEYVNPTVARLTGYTPDELYSNPGLLLQLFHHEDRAVGTQMLSNQWDYTRPVRMRLTHREARIVHSEHALIAVYDPEGQLVAVQGVARNKQQRVEEEIRYLGYRDELTSLYNRGYFEHALRCQKDSPVYPFSILVAGVNGLKMTKDAFSYADGDRLLITAGRILRESVGSRDAVCRLGGEEFTVLMPGVEASAAEQVCIRVREACRKAPPDPIQMSMALGAATQDDGMVSIREVLSRAEDSMYRVKLLEKTSAHSAIISSLQKTLSEKSAETEEHAERLRDLCLRMGRILRLPDSQISDLSLLALLHDLGKVAIPDEILMKPGPLTREQWSIMRRHSEIGYRIASALPGLLHVANSILSHHERWDGKGYPQGLGGENIPLSSRILSIIDAWDAMVYGRQYKSPTSHDDALAELQRCAGTQFDAHLITVFSRLLAKPRHTPGQGSHVGSSSTLAGT